MLALGFKQYLDWGGLVKQLFQRENVSQVFNWMHAMRMGNHTRSRKPKPEWTVHGNTERTRSATLPARLGTAPVFDSIAVPAGPRYQGKCGLMRCPPSRKEPCLPLLSRIAHQVYAIGLLRVIATCAGIHQGHEYQPHVLQQIMQAFVHSAASADHAKSSATLACRCAPGHGCRQKIRLQAAWVGVAHGQLYTGNVDRLHLLRTQFSPAMVTAKLDDAFSSLNSVIQHGG